VGLYGPQVTSRLAILTKATFETLVRTHQGAIRNFLRRLTGETAIADELAQKAFLKAFQTRHKLRDLEATKSWLFKIAYRTFLDHARKESRRRHLTLEGPCVSDPIAGASLQAPDGLKMDISRAMDNLPPDRRAVIILCLAHGMSHAEAAHATGLPIGTVKSHLLRGKEKLRTFLSAYETVK